MDSIWSFFGRSGYLPQGDCLAWSGRLLWTLAGANTVTALAFFSIPLAIASFLRRRPATSLRPYALLFGAFVFAVGLTHAIDVLTLWRPDYGLEAFTQVATAAVSIAAAIAVWALVPRALRIPSLHELRSVIGSLEAEIRRRRSAEENLQDTQQSLAVTLASIEAGFIATDREGRVTRLNAVAAKVLGWSEAEALGRSLWDVFQREKRPPALRERNPVDVALERRYDVSTPQQAIAIARDGTRTAIEVRAAPTHADDGTVRGLVLVFRDMSRLIRAEAESVRLAAIVESSVDAIVGNTLDGRITSWNPAAHTLFGWTADEAIGQPVQMLIPPERADEEMRILADLAHGGRVAPFETERRTRDGRHVQVSLSISPIRDASGRIVGAATSARDVGARRRDQAARRDSDERLRFALDSAQIGDWDLDLVSGVSRRSPGHDRCFGYPEPQREWSFDTFVRHVHPDDRDEVVQSFLDAVSALQDWRAECRVIWPDASVHWITVHGRIRHEGGKPVRMLGIVQDTTEQHLADSSREKAQRLEAENRQIQEASRLKSQFLANMSHELRTPLNAIIGFADLLQAGTVPAASPKHQQFLGHIATSGRHLLQLINDVLDLSKVESGKFEFYPEPLHLPTLVREVKDILHTATERKHMAIATELDPVVARLVLDPARLKQVLYNYLSNAIKFTHEGGKVTLRARPQGPHHVRLEVEDTGIGIAPDNLPRLFMEFQQLDAGYTKKHQGTGLGLALTRRLVEAQGGEVGVQSTPGAGSVFHLVLPRVHGEAAGAPAAPDAAAPAAPSLLVIEDRDPARLVEAMAQVGYAVDTATTADEALRHARDRAYDAIALDLLLREPSGLGVLDGIRREGASRAAPVVGVTVPIGDATATFAVADVLSKPLRTEEIERELSRFRRPQPARPNVLVVDDDPLALELMRAALKRLDIDCVCLTSGREALRDIDHHRPDAIVLDLMMPEMDGFAVLDALRRMPMWRHTPVFIWTSMVLTDEECAVLARSARAIVRKGGGALQSMLEDLRRRLPALAEPGERP